jgi:hypothetical protein
MIFRYLWIVNTNTLYVILYFKQLKKTKYTYELWTKFSLSKQTDRMVSRSNQILRPIDIEDNVTILIPNVDKGRGDPRNILCIVIHSCSDTKRYKLGIVHGLLNLSIFEKPIHVVHFSWCVRILDTLKLASVGQPACIQ